MQIGEVTLLKVVAKVLGVEDVLVRASGWVRERVDRADKCV